MLSATAVHEIRAPVASVWHGLLDAGAYAGWHPFLRGEASLHRDLRSDDRLTVALPSAGDLLEDPSIRALVVEVRRHRLASMVLQQRTVDTAGVAHPDDLGLLETVGTYRVDIEAGRAGHVILMQRLSLRHPTIRASDDLVSLLDEVAARITERTESAGADEIAGRPITGTVCVSSRAGSRRQMVQPQSRLLSSIAEWMARLPGRGAV